MIISVTKVIILGLDTRGSFVAIIIEVKHNHHIIIIKPQEHLVRPRNRAQVHILSSQSHNH